MTVEISIKPRSEREALIAKRIESSKEHAQPIYDFRGDTLYPLVVSLPIDVPVYRMANCRTFSAQQSVIAKQHLAVDFFEKGQEFAQAQNAQHMILAKLSQRGTSSVTPIFKVLSSDGQQEPILITSTGTVVNGNRRLSAMRELHKSSDGDIDQRFAHIKCAILPPDTTRDEIDDIEAALQARPETKLDYDWIGDASLIRRQVNKGRSTREVADQLRRSKQDIENTLQALEEADLYLTEWADKPGEYDLLSADGEQLFKDIPKNISNKDVNLENASRAIAWSLFENRDKVSGRLYSYNAAFGKLAPNVLNILSDRLDLDDIEADQDDGGDEFAIDIEAEEVGTDFAAIINALKEDETKDDAVASLIDACDTAIETDKGHRNEKAALKALSQAQAKLTGIDALSAGDSTLPAMLKQVESIRDVLNKIERAVLKRQEDGSATNT